MSFLLSRFAAPRHAALSRRVLAFSLAIAVVTHHASTAAQPRKLTVADLPKPAAHVPAAAVALRGLMGKPLVERVVSDADNSAWLRIALSLTSAEFQKQANAERVIAELSALRADSMKPLLPMLVAPIEARDAQRIRQQALGANRTAAAGIALSAHQSIAPGLMARARLSETVSWAMPAVAADWPADTRTFTMINEYEMVVDGMTANVREEVTMLNEGRQVGIRHLKRETVEQNGDPAAAGRYVVEQGVIEGGTNTVKTVRPRRLRPTSTQRVTTETFREAKVDRCPDASGITRGETVVSVTIRATAAATGSGAPSLLELTARGTATGRVNDVAELVGTDWEVTSESRMEHVSRGEDFRLSQTTRLVTDSSGAEPVVTGTVGKVDASGVGTPEEAQKIHSHQDGLTNEGYGPLLLAFDSAKASWRGGGCVELTVTSGAEPKGLQAGESRRLVIDAKHRYDVEPPAIPVTANPSGGSLSPRDPVRTPSAALTFTADPKGDGGGLVALTSTSRRGIAREVNLRFDPVDEDSLLIRYVYSGFKFTDSTAEDCPGMRTSGQEILTARVRLVRSSDGTTVYAGKGRFSADIDGCGLTPNRKDPGGTGNGSGFGGFNGDNFLGCKVTAVAPDREVSVTLDLLVYDDPQYLKISWEPIGRAPEARVTSECEAPWHAEHEKNLTSEYRRTKREEITDLEALQKMVAGGGLRPGTYAQPDGSPEGRWTLTVTKAGKQ